MGLDGIEYLTNHELRLRFSFGSLIRNAQEDSPVLELQSVSVGWALDFLLFDTAVGRASGSPEVLPAGVSVEFSLLATPVGEWVPVFF